MLTAKQVERTAKPGRYRDRGGVPGLLLQISTNGAKSYVLRYERHGRERMLGLGSASILSLKDARERARQARLLILDGIDPVDHRRAQKAAALAAAAKVLTFKQAAERYHAAHEAEWNSSHGDQVLASLQQHAFPVFGHLDVAQIDTPMVLKALQPIWQTKTTTAMRVRGRIESVLDYAVVHGARPAGHNSARWKGHLDQLLARPNKIAKVEHLAALPYAELPAFMEKLRTLDSIPARALEFTILTAARSGEVTGARWQEIDFETATWTVPAERMKGGTEHRVMLSPAAISLLRALPVEDNNPNIFVGSTAGAGLTKNAMRDAALHLIRSDITVHGFRSTFSDWAHECTSHSDHTIEISLSHKVGSAVERSYRRGPMAAKRVKLMADWAKYCASTPISKGDNVTAIRAAT
jgi:integrase